MGTVSVSVDVCVALHYHSHEPVCKESTGTVTAIICRRCHWMLQKRDQIWTVRGTFEDGEGRDNGGDDGGYES